MKRWFVLKITLAYGLLLLGVIFLPLTSILKILAAGTGLLLLHMWVDRSLGKRLETFALAARQYLKNDRDQPSFETLEDEFSPLIKALNQTDLVLRSRIKEKEAEKKNFTVVLDHMIEGVIAVDASRQVLLINQAARLMFPAEKKIILPKSLIELTFHPELDKAVELALQKGGLHTQEIDISYPEPKQLSVHIVGIDRKIQEISAILVLHDISKIRKLENIRREFVANVSHEIKTPLTSILGFIETLLNGAGENPQTRNSFLQMMQDDSRRLSRLIQDLLELSSLESRAVALHKIKVEVAPLVARVLKMFQLQMEEKKIKVQNHVAPALNLWVLADEDKFKQVLINLLDNAIKFNRDQGCIQITVKKTPDSFIVLTVEDQGVGIPEDSLDRVFERFYRVDKARSRSSSGGSGLGLSIVKHIVESHGGKVSCQSRLNQGSAFSISLPAA